MRNQNGDAHNMRTFEVPACRGFLLTTRTKEQHEFFPEEDGCLMFSDVKELCNQLNRATSDEALVQRIRGRSFELTKNQNYEERAKYLLSIVRDF